MNKVDDLIANGAVQISRKHRQVYVPKDDALDWLKQNRPEIYDAIVERCLSTLESDARNCVRSIRPEDSVVSLSDAEFSEFYEKTRGRKPWSVEGKSACGDCGSLGHMHRRTCINYK